MSTSGNAEGWVVLRRAGVCAVIDTAGPYLPRIVHWGADLGPLTDADCATLPGARFTPPAPDTRDATPPATVSPTRALGWPGRPGLSGHRAGTAAQPLFAAAGAELDDPGRGDPAADTTARLSFRGADPVAQLRLDGEIELDAAGVLRTRQTLTSTAGSDAAPYSVDELSCALPVGEHVEELLDCAGRWGNEARLQRHRLAQGSWLREQRRGRTGPDSPLLLMAGTPGLAFGQGELWGVHLGWSGDQRYLAQRLNTGAVLLGAGEILAAGEVILGPGESVTTPWLYGTYSGEGIDGASARLHAMLRRREHHPRTPRPVVLNTWEAVYFDHGFDRLSALADVAAAVGVERFVVDDGWFGSRRGERSGLGDWFVAPAVWPDGLGALADHVRGRGMRFGLWVEPEMISPDSELARSHPEWVLGTPGRMPPPSRYQQVLDLANPGAYDHVRTALSALVDELSIEYLKWDHNRDLADPVHRSGPRAGQPAVRDQTFAAYRLMDELRARHPGLEIESCSSGGARVDYGVLEHTDRVWASDCGDPIERVGIVAGTATLLPFELIGAHVASPRSHVTGRVHDLSLRLVVATFGHAGIEWDLTACTAAERARLTEWVSFVRAVRPLLASGRLVRVDRPDGDGTAVFGVVSPDASEALFAAVRLRSSPRYGAAPVRLPGLDPASRYRVTRVELGGGTPHDPSCRGAHDHPGQLDGTGAQLTHVGFTAPGLMPEQATMYRLRRLSESDGQLETP